MTRCKARRSSASDEDLVAVAMSASSSDYERFKHCPDFVCLQLPPCLTTTWGAMNSTSPARLTPACRMSLRKCEPSKTHHVFCQYQWVQWPPQDVRGNAFVHGFATYHLCTLYICCVHAYLHVLADAVHRWSALKKISSAPYLNNSIYMECTVLY